MKHHWNDLFAAIIANTTGSILSEYILASIRRKVSELIRMFDDPNR